MQSLIITDNVINIIRHYQYLADKLEENTVLYTS